MNCQRISCEGEQRGSLCSEMEAKKSMTPGSRGTTSRTQFTTSKECDFGLMSLDQYLLSQVSVFPVQEKTLMCQNKFNEEPPAWLGVRMGDLGLFSLQKTKLRKDLSLCLQLPNEGGDAQQKDKKQQTQITKKALTKFRGNIFTR